MHSLTARRVFQSLVLATALCSTRAFAQSNDTAFSALQTRGKMAMGVDQYESAHRFDALADGGRISLQMKDADSLAVAQIRAHLKLIQHAFRAGDFSTPE